MSRAAREFKELEFDMNMRDSQLSLWAPIGNPISSARKTFQWLINEIDKYSKLSKRLSL